MQRLGLCALTNPHNKLIPLIQLTAALRMVVFCTNVLLQLYFCWRALWAQWVKQQLVRPPPIRRCLCCTSELRLIHSLGSNKQRLKCFNPDTHVGDLFEILASWTLPIAGIERFLSLTHSAIKINRNYKYRFQFRGDTEKYISMCTHDQLQNLVIWLALKCSFWLSPCSDSEHSCWYYPELSSAQSATSAQEQWMHI